MKHALIFDCEFLTSEGSPSRHWCGPHDPDPIIVQIGLVRLGLASDFPLLESKRLYVKPRDRNGMPILLDPFFTNLTGISQEKIELEGLDLPKALDHVKHFSAGVRLWSWGKDEFNMIAISSYVAGLSPPIPATQFGNACQLLLLAGMPYEDIKRTRSSQLAEYFGIDLPPLRAHDALDDALSLAYSIQNLLRRKLLDPASLH